MPKRVADGKTDCVKQKKPCVQDEKQKFLDCKLNARSLSKTQVVYSRSEDSIIIRDLYPDTKFHRFGIDGVSQIEQVFFWILNELNNHREDLLEKMHYGGERLSSMLDGLSDTDREDMRSNSEQFKKNYPTTSIKVKNVEFPKLTMLKISEDKELQYGVYLFINDAVTLLKHMNELMGISESECFKSVETGNVNKFEDDDFF